MARFAVLGAGSWGTAFTLVLGDAGHEVHMWGRRQSVCDAINNKRENTEYLPGVTLADSVEASHDPRTVLADREVVVLAVPSQQLRSNLEEWAEHIPADALIVSLMKGIELGSHKRMSEVIAELTGAGPDRIAVVSGPNLAHEIADREPAATVVACADAEVAEHLQRMCHTRSFRPYTITDVVGCELGGTVKNVIGLAVGVAVGLGYGDNARASVITRGLAETARLGAAMGADPRTLSGLAGMGDLVATCSSPLSRNRTFGEKLGRGMSVEQVVGSTRQIAEGVKSCESVSDLAASYHVDMPIVDHVVSLVRGEMTPVELVDLLVSREAKPEVR